MQAASSAGPGPAGPGPASDDSDAGKLKLALTLIVLFMTAEIVVAVLSSSLALLSDAAHMLTDAAALAMALLAARLAARPAKGAMTFGLGRAEILSANANGMTLLVLGLLIVYGAVQHLVRPPDVDGAPVLIVALVGIVVNLVVTRVLGGHGHGPVGHAHAPLDHAHEHAGPGHAGHDHSHDTHDRDRDRDRDRDLDHDHDRDRDRDHDHDHDNEGHTPRRRSLNIEGSYQHILTDLFGFVATAIAAIVILETGFRRADAIASLLIACFMLHAAFGLIKASMRVMMEAAPEGIDPDAIGRQLAAQPGVTEVHDLHIWEVTSGFPAISAHVVVDPGHDCHEIRRALSTLLRDQFGLGHSTLQVEHARAPQAPMQIEVVAHDNRR